MQAYDYSYKITGKDPICTISNSCEDAIVKSGEKLSLLLLPDRICFSEY